MDKPYKVLIIGCGSIGALKPIKFDSPASKLPLTHAHAFNRHPDFEITGVCDMDKEKADEAADRWGTLSYTDIDRATREAVPNIIVIASPTTTHLSMVQKAIWNAPLLLVEKPMGENTKQWRRMKSGFVYSNTDVLINYMRRYLPAIQRFRDTLLETEVLSARLIYGQGLQRDGCHGLDLFRYLLGECIGVTNAYNTPYKVKDEGDSDYRARLAFERCHYVDLVPIPTSAFSVFQMEFITTRGIFNLHTNGQYLEHLPVAPEGTYGNYPALKWIGTHRQHTDLDNVMTYMAEHCSQILQGNEKPKCTFEDGLAVHRIIEDIRRKADETSN